MKKKLFSALLAVGMLFAMAPAALAVDAEPEGTVTASKAGVNGESELVMAEDGTYTIQLSLSGVPYTTEQTINQPADVVLIVDNSGSMNQKTEGESCTGTGFTLVQDSRTHKSYWKCTTCGAEHNITWKNRKCDVCEETHKVEWGSEPTPPAICGAVNSETASTRIDIAKKAAKLFIDKLTTDPANGVAVVGFSSEEKSDGYWDYDWEKNEWVWIPGEVTKEATNGTGALTNSSEVLYAAVDQMVADGGTSYTAALQKATDILDKREDASRPAYVVFISDGAPGLYGTAGLEDYEYNGIKQADSLKANGVTIYTIGIEMQQDADGMLKAISSTDEDSNPLTYSVSDKNLESDLSGILSNLAKKITSVTTTAAGVEVVFTDVVDTERFKIEACSDGLTLGEDGKTLTWTLAEIPSQPQTQLIKISPVEGLSGKINTNTSVALTYTDTKTKTQITLKDEQIGEPYVKLYKVIYNDGADGEVFKEKSTGSLSKLPEVAQEKDPVRDHYKFTGWKQEDSEDGYVRTFTAQWKAETYTVTYNDGVDGDDIFQDQKTENLSFGDKTPEFKGTPTREGYRFDSWEPKVEETVTGNATYAATWVKTYTVTYKDGANGTVFEDQATTVDAGSATPVFNGETPERPGYKFAGWDKKIAETVTEDAVYTAQWEEVLVPTQSPSAPADPTPAPTPTDEHPEIAQLIAEGKWGGTPTPTKTATVPQTSDNSNPMLWVVMLVLAAAGLAGVVVLKKRQHNK